MTKEEFEEANERLLNLIKEGIRHCAARDSELYQKFENGTISRSEWEDGIRENREFMALLKVSLTVTLRL